MKYSKVYIEAFGYELAPNVVTTDDLEERLKPFYEATNINSGQLTALTGIKERRFWDVDHSISEETTKAGQKAIAESGISPDQIDSLVYCGVCREGFEPATSCAIANNLNISPNAHIYDVSNACLGVITGMIQVANEIELGNIKTGLVVSCETSRQIVDSTIDEINENKTIEFFKEAVATMTGGSGAIAILLTDGSFSNNNALHKITGTAIRNSNQYHNLCSWGFSEKGMPVNSKIIMRTKAENVLEYGTELVVETFNQFLKDFNLSSDKIDKFIGHQVGAIHHQYFYNALGIDMKKDFSTFPFLGNIGTVSLPITAAIADEREFLNSGDFVCFIGIGSGLNCLIMGIEW
ncbi:MAG: 3-oxoacyl-ACP synthase III [Desulfobacteraceae bacterium]|nr:3-oxoacyl-ACP synthase III [Desulfobacteraceae bacterium]